MQTINRYITNNDAYKTATIIQPQGLMLHSIGTNQPFAKNTISGWNKPGSTVAAHAIIEPKIIYETLPYNYRCSHCGGSGNNTHIAVEMTEPADLQYIGGATFTYDEAKKPAIISHIGATYNLAAILFADLCRKYNLDPLKSGVIVSHNEGCQLGIAGTAADKHYDPDHMGDKFGYTMDKFRQKVKDQMIIPLVPVAGW
ncbi:MAG: peptidoglycan recognition protein family protein [Peptococcaceae bacterium]|nr:peptidoglycan recognition protein family protein [Peptococcaceae bacterium]